MLESTPQVARQETRVVILGAGVCGLYAGLELCSAGVPVSIVERESGPGGLAAGRKRGDNYFDLGVHMLHGFDEEILSRIKRLMGDESTAVELDARVRWIGRDFRYPLQLRDMIKGIPPLTLVQCIAGLLVAETKNRVMPRVPANAEEALIQLYGRPLYRFFFEQFTERYWGTPSSKLSATFVSSKMPRLAVRDMVLSILRKLGLKQTANTAVPGALLDETLYYSNTGAEAMPRKMVESIRGFGGEILLGCSVDRVRIDPSTGIFRIEFEDRNGGRLEHRYGSHCISTIPVPTLVKALDPAAPDEIMQAAARLRYKPIVIYGLLVNKPKALDALYIYYRNRMFHRIGEPKNAGLRVVPENHTVLIVEITCEVGDERWSGAAGAQQQLFQELEQESVCSRDQVAQLHTLQCPEGYPIFSLGFERHLESVSGYIDTLDNLYSTGRQGAFCYPNMHTSMRMGSDIAKSIARQLYTNGLKE